MSDIAPTPRGARTIRRILDAAARSFAREGYEGASMKAVARAAGVSKGLLHYHFRNKEHLLIEAQRATFKRIHDDFEARFEQGDRGIDTALEAVDALWHAIREMRTWAPFMVETMSMRSRSGALSAHLQEFYDESMGLLERGIERLFEGELDRLALPPERLAWVVRTALHGLVVELAYARGEADLVRVDRVYADLRDLFPRVLYQEGPHDP